MKPRSDPRTGTTLERNGAVASGRNQGGRGGAAASASAIAIGRGRSARRIRATASGAPPPECPAPRENPEGDRRGNRRGRRQGSQQGKVGNPRGSPAPARKSGTGGGSPDVWAERRGGGKRGGRGRSGGGRGGARRGLARRGRRGLGGLKSIWLRESVCYGLAFLFFFMYYCMEFMTFTENIIPHFRTWTDRHGNSDFVTLVLPWTTT